MYMSRFGVKNYKCLADVDIPLTPIHVLIGENDAGKTSVLEAISALYASPHEKLKYLFPEPWDGRELVLHGVKDPRLSLAAEWRAAGTETEENAELRYQFAVSFPFAGTDCTRLQDEEKLIYNGRLSDLLASMVSSDKSHTVLFERLADQLFVSPANRLPEYNLVRSILKATSIYRFDPHAMKRPATIDPAQPFRLDADGSRLAPLLHDILGHDATDFIKLQDQFCRLFPQFRRVRVQTENIPEPHPRERAVYAQSVAGPPEVVLKPAVGASVYLETHTGETIRAQQASDGAILLLGFLAIAHLPEPPTLLLIEEPENGVYPKRLGQVIELLKQMVQGDGGVRFPQIIMTTHSPYVLSFFEPEEVTFLSRDPEKPEAGVRARPLRDAANIREWLGGGGFYLGELWYNMSEKELFGDP